MTSFKGVLLATNDIDASILFYTELLGMEVADYREGHVIFREGLELYSLSRFSELTSQGESHLFFGSASFVLSFETLWFEKVLLCANKAPFSGLEYRIFTDKGKRGLLIHDPDMNLIIIKEGDDNTLKKHNEPLFDIPHERELKEESVPFRFNTSEKGDDAQ